MLLILSIDGLAWGCLSNHCFVGCREYCGIGGCSGAVSTGSLGAIAAGVGQPGLGGLVGGWTSLTKSNPDKSDLLSDSRNWQSLDGARSGCACIISFAGN